MPDFVLRAMIVDRQPYVVLLDEALDARQAFGRGVSRDNDVNTCAPGILEVGANAGVIVFEK